MALDFFGPDHMMFATDFPSGSSHGERCPLDELRNIKTMPLDEAERDKILYRNAQRLLKLPATPGPG
jgi:predicted TIM-barrel fold metal-dependent hydrolase